jgi:hypothetical protein
MPWLVQVQQEWTGSAFIASIEISKSSGNWSDAWTILWRQDENESGLRYDADVIVPIPLHPARKRKRGYNQSAKFAEGLPRD